jgi:hypothetical protein
MNNDSLHKDLVKLADILETCEPGSSDFNYYNHEYRKVAKILYPEMYKSKPRKPSRKFLNTLTRCTCGSQGIKIKRYISGGLEICCHGCGRMSELKLTLPEARDSWNKTFLNE